MRPVPIPDAVAAATRADAPDGWAERHVIGGEAGTTPAEYVVTRSTLYPGRLEYHALIELDDEDRAAIAAGAHLTLSLDGAEVPWSLATYVTPT